MSTLYVLHTQLVPVLHRSKIPLHRFQSYECIEILHVEKECNSIRRHTTELLAPLSLVEVRASGSCRTVVTFARLSFA